jgi:hypothetical protein
MLPDYWAPWRCAIHGSRHEGRSLWPACCLVRGVSRLTMLMLYHIQVLFGTEWEASHPRVRVSFMQFQSIFVARIEVIIDCSLSTVCSSVYWLGRSVAGRLPRGPGFDPRQVIWRVWWIKRHWDRISSAYGFPVSGSFYECSITIN